MLRNAIGRWGRDHDSLLQREPRERASVIDASRGVALSVKGSGRTAGGNISISAGQDLNVK